MLAFIESGNFIYGLAVLAAIGIITKLASAIRYSRLERQAEDVGSTRDSYIRLWKNKFENAYRINKGMEDPGLYVERCLYQCKLLGIQLTRWDRVNRVLCSICLLLGVAAVTVEQRSGLGTGLILGHFLTSLCICGLMVFIEFFCETGDKRQRIGINLEDYFVNTLSHRLQAGVETVTAESESAKAEEREAGERRRENKEALRREDLHREEQGRDKDRDSLKESLERIAASRDPGDDERRDRRSRRSREEDARLIEEILRDYLR